MIPEQPISLTVGPDLSLEALLALPPSPPAGVVICHPHPLYGGDMENPVVVRVQEVCAGLGLATLRFNFRGVGASGGVHGGGVGEQDDAAAALDALAKAMGGGTLAIAGYSFGSRIAALVGSRDGRVGGIALIAPPLAMSDFGFLEDIRVPTLAVAGTITSSSASCSRSARRSPSGRSGCPGVGRASFSAAGAGSRCPPRG